MQAMKNAAFRNSAYMSMDLGPDLGSLDQLGRRTDVVVRADAGVALARPPCRNSYELCSIAPGLARIGYA